MAKMPTLKAAKKSRYYNIIIVSGQTPKFDEPSQKS
jgi:hypothetical protein